MRRDSSFSKAPRCGMIDSSLLPDTSMNLLLKFDTIQLPTQKVKEDLSLVAKSLEREAKHPSTSSVEVKTA